MDKLGGSSITRENCMLGRLQRFDLLTPGHAIHRDRLAHGLLLRLARREDSGIDVRLGGHGDSL